MPIRHNADDIAHENEPAQVRDLTKKALYARLNNEWYIPECASRGVNRRYLVGVFTGEYFRVNTLEFKRFDAELTPAQKKKAPILNGADAVRKINKLLQETQRPILGFASNMIPEEIWFINVARYIDKQNLCGIFTEALPGAPGLDCESQIMAIAKRNAERFLLGDRNLLANKYIYAELKEVWEHQKKIAGKRIELQALAEHGRALELKINDDEAQIHARLLKASLTIFSHGNGVNNSDNIFHEENGNAQRLQLNEITQL